MTEKARTPMSNDDMSINLTDILPGITAKVVEQLQQRATERLSYAVTEAVDAATRRYIEETILPGVNEELQKHEAELRAAIVTGIHMATMALAEAIREKATERIASYDGDKLMNDVVGALFARRY